MLDYFKDPGSLGTLSVTGFLSLAIWVGLLGVKVFAFVDALRYSNNHYVSAGKRSRTLWLVLTGLSLAFHLISDVLFFANLAGTIASIVYLVDVRPALQQVSGRGGGNRNNMGPYGPW